MLPKDIWPKGGLRVFLLLLNILNLSYGFKDSDLLADWGFSNPVLVNGTDDMIVGNLNLEEVMVELRRMKRSLGRNSQQQYHPAVPYAQPCPVSGYRSCCQSKSRSIPHRRMYPELRSTIVVDERGIPVRETDFPPRPRRSENEPEPLYRRRARRVRFCPILVSAPPIPPPETGRCHLSPLSGREICYPEYEALDTSCTDVRSDQGSGLVAPPVVKHATVRAMAFVPPDNLRRLIRQYYRQLGKPIPADTKFSPQSFLFVKYKCEFGYEFVDEIDTMYCQNKQWVLTPPVCRGKGPCEVDNGGCSHSCLSFDNRTVECRCPKGFILDTDKKTCIKPVPKNLCRNLAGCRCTALDDVQFSCTCTGTAEKCLLLKGPPKIYLTPNPPFSAIPGGSINITCQAVGYPFPTITWKKEDDNDLDIEHRRGAYRSEQVLMVKEVYKNSKFVCVAKNDEGSTERAVEVAVLGPGSAPILKTANAGRTSIQISWDPPHLQNRPIISYTLYYTTNPQEPLKFWKKMHVNEPQRQLTIPHLIPHKTYYIRVRALDKEGPGKPSSTVSVSTLKPPKIPTIEIVDGAEKLIAPNTSFAVSCNVTDSDPTPSLYWASRGRPITQQKTTRLFTIQHNGLIEDAVFTCTANNEAGTDEKNVSILIAGPSMPERIRYNVDGTSVQVFWEKPKYENSEIKDYEILYTKDPSLPLNEWQSSKVGDPVANTFTVSGLDEKTPYSFKIRGISDRGPGQPSLGFDIQTWLGPREPEVTLNPSEPIVSRPSTAELVFNCEATGVPKPKIIWLSNGIPIEDGKEDYRIYEVKIDNELDKTSSKLTSQSTTKSGPITCQAINKNGHDEKRVDVKILGPGSPPKNIKPSTQENGFTVEWEPPEHPNGQISKYVIYYTPEDSDAELADYITKVVDGSDTSVTIGNQNEDTPFIIRMQAISDDGPGIISETYTVKSGQKHIPLLVRLEVIDPPTVEGEETVVEPKQIITFRCVAEGRPGPTISYSWLPFNNTESGEEPVAISTNPSPDAEHRYQTDSVTSATSTRRKLLCQARNQDGTVKDSHVFNVKKPGSSPKEVSPIVDIDNRATIKWDVPDHPNGDLTGYKVYLSPDPEKPLDSWQVFDVPVAPDGEPKIEFGRGELEPDTPYYVRIAAKNDDGEGVLSDPKGFETVSGAPIDSPTDTVVDIAEDNTVNLTWSGPKQPNGPLQGYTVYFTPSDPNTRDEDYKSWTKVDIPTTNDTGFVSLDNDAYNIIPNHEYKARITAKNDMNEGPPSETTVFKTGSGELPPIITLTPDDNPFLIPPRSDVSIKCEATGVPMPKVKWVVGTEEHLTSQLRLVDVRKDVTATCIATNNAGEAQQIVDIQVQGPGTPPNEVVVLPMPNQEINVEWTAPDESNGPLKEYVIHYGEVPEGEREPTEWQTITVSPDAVRDKITNVKPKTNYAVKVQAVSERGPGVQSSPIIVQTLPLAPVAPESADVIVHDNNTVVIQFDAVPNPENKTTNVKSYKILYTPEDPSLDTTTWKELIWNQPDDQPIISVPIDGENFSPDTKYNVKVIPIGEIEGPSSDNVPFQTGDGIIPPDKPVINVDLEDGNIVRVPAGSDYTVSCTSQGFPTPYVRWVDQEGNQLSEDGMLRVYDIKTHKKAKCLAENPGGVKETDFTIYVAGPGNAPENIRVSANHPRTIDVRWDPPTIPNGNITRYIIYYTPLDDQERAYQVGQVPKKPISEWMTYHVIGEHLNEGEKHARLTDFVDADTAYAIVIQAANDDGPGPYSIQHSIRTMSKAREAAPKDLRVDPLNQTSADASWKPPEPSDEALLGYELYFIEADKEIDEDDIISLPNWEKIAIDDPAQLKYKLIDGLKADTEYVFKIRAIYANGPGVFSEACITKTPPVGSPPYIVVSAGGHGVHGTTDIDLLPGSSFTVFCNASGDPQPTVKWIRGGSLAIDPSMVKSDDSAAEWSLKLTNLTEDTTFLCYAHNPLGHANWTINIKIDKAALPEEWNKDGVKARLDNGEQTLHFSDVIPENLKRPGDWIIHYTDDPTLPLDQWQKISADGTKLDKVVVPDLVPGTTYHIVIENPKEGVTSPEFVTTAPRPPHDLRVGTSINDETVIDFKPAVSSDDITEHMIRYWPSDDEGEVNYVKINPENITSGTIIDGLLPGKEYVFQPIAQVQDADDLVGDKVKAKMPTDDVECDCSHACIFTENAQNQPVISCYCPEGYELAEDGKNCVEGVTKEENEVVEIGPTISGEQIKPEEVTATTEGQPGYAITIPTEAIQTVPTIRSEESLYPTDFRGATVIVEQAETDIIPTDGQGKIIKPIITIDGKLLPTDDYGTTFNQIGHPVDKDEFGIPLDPTGKQLKTNEKDEWVYPPLDQDGNPLPTDANTRYVFPVIDKDGTLEKNDEGANIYRDGSILPTNAYGKPTGPDGSPLPTDELGRYVLTAEEEDSGYTQPPTDATGKIIYPIVDKNGKLLPTDYTGAHTNWDNEPIETNEAGVPLGPDGGPLPTDSLGRYVHPQPSIAEGVRPTTSDGRFVTVIGPDGEPVTTDSYGNPVHPDTGEAIPTNSQGQYVGPDGSPLPTDDNGNVIVISGTSQPPQTLPTDPSGKIIYPIIGSDGQLLPTDDTGVHVNKDGEPIDTNQDGIPLGPDGDPLPTDSLGRFVHPEPSTGVPAKPTTIHYLRPDGQLAPTDASGAPVHPDTGKPYPTDPSGKHVGPDGSPLPTDQNGNVIVISGTEQPPQTLPTDPSGKVIYPIIGSDGQLLPTDATGVHVDKDGEAIDTNEAGVPLGPDGGPLPTDSLGRYVLGYDIGFPTSSPGQKVVVIGPDGQVLPTNFDGHFVYGKTEGPLATNIYGSYVGLDGSPLPTSGDGKAFLYPTNSAGNLVYPVVDSDNVLLPTDATGAYLDSYGTPIGRNDDGTPMLPDGSVLPTNNVGQFVFIEEPRPSSPYCFVSAYIDLILVFDTSNNIRILDYRVMKEAVKQFLSDHFNMKENRVRVGVVKYGDAVEIPVALGDYDHSPDLLARIGDTRRMRGEAHLGHALRDVASEFLISGITGAPRVVIVFKSGPSVDDVAEPAQALRDEFNANIFVVAVGNDNNENKVIVGNGNENHVLNFDQWRGIDSSDIGPLADVICKAVPDANQVNLAVTWPARKTTVPVHKTVRTCNRIDYPVDVMVVVDSSTFDDDEFEQLKESVGVLIDESFDLAPDVARAGFIVYTDKVSVPVALGHYEDKIELLQKISDSDRISGQAIALKSLDAARQQFVLHGRQDASKVIVLITNGNNRGNAALAAQDLREGYGIQIFAIAVNPTAERHASLARLVGSEYADTRLLKINAVQDLSGDQLSFIRQSLCGHITPAAGSIESTEPSWTTTKRSSGFSIGVTPSDLDDSSRRTTRALQPIPLCKDGYLRPYLLSVVIDVTARSTPEDFRRVLDMISEFLEDKFGLESDRMVLNLVAVNSVDVSLKKSGISVSDFSSFTSNLLQNENDEVSPKLGMGIDAVVELAKSHEVRGVNKVILIVSSDATSSDDALPSAEIARDEYEHKIMAISVRKPTTELLKDMADNSPSRVIHLSEWLGNNELFNSWFSYAICESIGSTSQPKSTTVTTKRPKQKPTKSPTAQEPSNINVIPISPTSFSVTWTCCTNNKADYVIIYTPDASLSIDKWKRIPARCRDSFGKVIDNLPSDSDYKVCVVTKTSANNNSAIIDDENCDSITLDKETTAPPDYEPWDQEQQTSPCQCLCSDDGSAVIQASCNKQAMEAFRPVATLPPAVEGECPCSVKAHAGRCPSGYFLQKSMCIDVNECQQQNGGCSHGCINTPGDFYCACPHGMMRDPADPKTCINVAGSFDRITELLAQYLHANSKSIDGHKVGVTSSDSDKGRRFKATIKTEDDKILSFEWPAMVRKALRWLI